MKRIALVFAFTALVSSSAVAHDAVGVLARRADGAVVNLHFRHPLAAVEDEIARDEITPTGKLKRDVIVNRFKNVIDELYLTADEHR